MISFQEIVRRLSLFWEQQGCVIHQGYDLEVGAGTFNPATFLRCLGPEPYRAAYIEPSRRPTDGRYGTNPNRVQHYFQFQVILKPSPLNIQDLYLKSLESIGFNLKEHDIRFVHDDWESPTLGAWGLGWEVWMDGMEVTQFTYFQAMAGIELRPITGEITYGIERLAMYLQKVDSLFDIQWNEHVTYGDIYQRNEVEWSHYNFEKASVEMWHRNFDDAEKEANRLITFDLPIPAYDFVLKASHAFNMLDARGVISPTERTGYIGRIRDLSSSIARNYIKSREAQQFPLLHRFKQKENNRPKPDLTLPESLVKINPEKREDFVLEIGSEELPAVFVPIGCTNLERALKQLLDKEGIAYEQITTFGTPRRLTAYVKQLALGKPSQITEKRGPPLDQAFESTGQIKPAGEGFFRSIGLSSPDLQTIREGKVEGVRIQSIKGTDYLFANLHIPGRATASILQESLPGLILGLDFPKKMRWADLDITFARPLRWLVALFGKDVVPFVIGDLVAGRESQGHRQLAPGAVVFEQASSYLPNLRKAFVMADTMERQTEITKQLDTLEKELKALIIARDRVIPQVLQLVEWPQLTAATFKEEFLRAPKEVLISEMVEHQKYFPVATSEGNLKNLFIITANIPPTDEIRRGNQKVLSARLSDGVFLYEQDLKSPIESYNEKLKSVIFQKELGSVYDKVERIKRHAKTLEKYFKKVDTKKVSRAATLCKADLASGMVYEFPELQGLMGKDYALAQGEDPEVAMAIDEHWMPRGENAPLPESSTGIIISLADKIDNLIGCFALDMKPTSSSDPYALRRQTLGIIKTLINAEQRLPLNEILIACASHFPSGVIANPQETCSEIVQFITNRIKTIFQDYGFNKDEIEASVSFGSSDVYDTFCKVKALHEFRRSNVQFPQLYEVYKRAKGQLNNHANINFSKNLLNEHAEKELDLLLEQVQGGFTQALNSQKYDDAYGLIAKLQPGLAKLFDEVKILADDPKVRDNRLALLQRVFGLFAQLLDFSKIQEKN